MNRRLIADEGHRNQMSPAELERRMTDWLATEYQAVLIEDAAAVVAYALYRNEPEFVYLRQFYVDAPFRRRGIGREAIAWLRENAWQGVPAFASRCSSITRPRSRFGEPSVSSITV